MSLHHLHANLCHSKSKTPIGHHAHIMCCLITPSLLQLIACLFCVQLAQYFAASTHRTTFPQRRLAIENRTTETSSVSPQNCLSLLLHHLSPPQTHHLISRLF